MRKLFFFLILFIFLSCNKESSSPDICYVSQEIRTLYQEDVYRLLFREIYFDSLHPHRSTPIFNENETQKLLQAIQSIYDQDMPERDTVLAIYNIHTFPDLGMRSISLNVNPEAEEITRMINGEPTGNESLDNLLTTFSFTEITPSLFYPEFNWITIVSDSCWNLFPIIEELSSFEFIELAELGGGAVGDGNDLLLYRTGTSLQFDFSIGWGDCPSGCINRRHWIFNVTSNCEPSFINSFTE